MSKVTINPFLKLLYRPHTRNSLRRNGIGAFHAFNVDFALKALRSKNPSSWTRAGEQMALTLFQDAARRVPAYKNFLRKNKIKPSFIRTIKDFQSIPTITKETYFKAYPLEALSWDGKIENNSLFSVSSGSSGKPFFWPRGDNLEIESSIEHALILKEVFGADRIPTLVIDSFSMGIYIAGVITLSSTLRSSELGMPITVITPGIELDDILRAIYELEPHYKQVVIAGYPPFVKDIIDVGELRGMKWKKMNIKFLFATENFSEDFRSYLLQKVGAKEALHVSVNIYGSAEAGILAHETPLSIAVRREAATYAKLAHALWGDDSSLPTFVQYNPTLRYFEEADGNLIFSAYGGIPLIRYAVGDNGALFSFPEISEILKTFKKDRLQKHFREGWKLPFVAVFGKSDEAISFYGVKIYPETIRHGLESRGVLKLVSGKFVMQQRNRKNQDQYWNINVELREGVNDTQAIKIIVKRSILGALREKNLEFTRLRAALGHRTDPAINLYPRGHKKYFDSKVIKQRWVKPK